MLLMGGAGGVPFMEDAEDLIDGAGQMMGYNISSKQWRKEAAGRRGGQGAGRVHGAGLSGLPGAPIDVSGRLGMGNLLPGTGLFLTKPSRERDLLEMVGPAGDLVAAASRCAQWWWVWIRRARVGGLAHGRAQCGQGPTWQPAACTRTPRATR
jgi:hypothetical protein